MSTSDGRPLTRRQLRELRQTGQTPILTEDDIAADRDARSVEDEPGEPAVETPEDDAEAAEPEGAEEDAEAEDDADGADVEELEVVEAPAEESAADDANEPNTPAADADANSDAESPSPAEGDVAPESGHSHPVLTRRQLREQERLRTHATPTMDAGQAEPETIEATIVTDEVPQAAKPATVDVEVVEELPEEDHEEAPAAPAEEAVPAEAEGAAGEAAATLRPDFGEEVKVEAITHSPASFDELLTQPQETSGSSSAPSTLVLDEIPAAAALSAPITATGELLITSSHKLPEGFGSSGAAKGTTDGREVDAVLIDGELPLSSSPTPIAASDAVSTSKSPGEVIRPPAPEKNHKLILTLGITAGGLGIAVVAAVVIAYATGVFG